MANTDKKLSVGEVVLWIILTLWLCSIFSCASQARQTPQMDSNHYVAQVQPQTYPCPSCERQIPMENISANIRTENKCPSCRKVFFGVPVVELKSEASQAKPYQGPKIFGRGYYSDIKYDRKFDHSVKNTWKVSPDGSSGSMSQTFIRRYEHTTKGEHGTIIGPAGLGHYGGY